MREFLILLGVVLFWITLNRWILPWFGIPTCMSGLVLLIAVHLAVRDRWDRATTRT